MPMHLHPVRFKMHLFQPVLCYITVLEILFPTKSPMLGHKSQDSYIYMN